MRRFRFSLDPLLELERTRVEMHFEERRRIEARRQSSLQRFERLQVERRTNAAKLSSGEWTSGAQLRRAESWGRKLQQEGQAALGAAARLEQERSALIEKIAAASQRVRALERLRNKRRAAFEAEARKAEEREAAELFQLGRRGRRSALGR